MFQYPGPALISLCVLFFQGEREEGTERDRDREIDFDSLSGAVIGTGYKNLVLAWRLEQEV